MKNAELNITFHNPNTTEETVKALVRLAAESAKLQINELIVHNEKSCSSKNACGEKHGFT